MRRWLASAVHGTARRRCAGRVRGVGGRLDDVVGDERGVAADAVDEVRVAAVLEALTEHVQAGHRGDAAAVADLARGVEDREVQPRVGAAVAGRPDDGAMPAARRSSVRGGAVDGATAGIGSASSTSRPSPVASMCGVDAAEELAHAAVGVGDAWRRGRRRAAPGAVDRRAPVRPGGRPSACRVARSSVGGRVGRPAAATARAGPRRRRRTSSIGACRGRRCGRATRRCPCRGSGGAGGCGGRPRAVTSRPARAQLVGELDAGGRRADDQHAPVGERVGVAVGGRDQLVDAAARSPATAGTAGRSHQPVAMTTLAARHGRSVGGDLEAVAVGWRSGCDGACALRPARRTRRRSGRGGRRTRRRS